MQPTEGPSSGLQGGKASNLGEITNKKNAETTIKPNYEIAKILDNDH